MKTSNLTTNHSIRTTQVQSGTQHMVTPVISETFNQIIAIYTKTSKTNTSIKATLLILSKNNQINIRSTQATALHLKMQITHLTTSLNRSIITLSQAVHS